MKLIAFNRGKAISADPIWMGTNRFVKPPKSAGIIRKKIIKKAWAVMSDCRHDSQREELAQCVRALEKRMPSTPAS